MQARFRTTPEVTKLEIREFLEKVYGIPVKSVRTHIVQGRLKKKQKRSERGFIRMKDSDYKLAYVEFVEKPVLHRHAINPLANIHALTGTV
jgi:large subunit ribosomal protein L23